MNISIFGLGYVGCVSLGCLAKNGHKVIGVDISTIKVGQINSGKATIIEKDIDIIIAEEFSKGHISATTDNNSAVAGTDISIVAVGTPNTEKGHLNLQYIFNVAERIGEALQTKNSFHIIAIRSTIMPGTCDKFADTVERVSGKTRNTDFAIVDNPEFLREGTAVQDYFNPPLTLIGSDHSKSAEIVADLYRNLPAEIIITTLKVAEIMKYVNNTYHALKISFANEVGNICSELDIDSHEVMDIFCRDKQLNISSYYFKPGFAYGGSCLPKDLRGFQTLAHDLYVKVPVIDSIDETNEIQIQRAVKIIFRYWNKKLGFLGLSFKAGTDDLRNSPAVAVIESLLGKGCDIRIYDKNINLSMLTGTNKEYIDSRIPHLSTLLTSDPNEIINDSNVIVINTKEPEFFNLVKDIQDKIIIDFVRLDESLLSKSNYSGINW
ncbi:MAG: GDP-mannose dehydrogenase [Bacteroidetes bacterium GWE2_41_25]|nr:MAG: GDP-mannose dehydrogenase [Bacteroidetes bacterium GWA2_40_15]OFX95274.1 MAG: GDP-mannose dehydrogenase [Bacteroidetes bacterium GWE2_41_25]OFX96182.1 MAG: GDP-mannose dehydrogenase [Bacteroidetes bacterium GWC2_40_22]OFY60719.1 MAG: GDP-mannose dehydrogenase [Bacteroidetes bacterium GWF2_41_9]HAM11311.1 GDP-mannose dehydrogenase [Bacteroidales bacterium]